jgi:hypothetical protein
VFILEDAVLRLWIEERDGGREWRDNEVSVSCPLERVAKDVKGLLTAQVWDGYVGVFKIAVVRDDGVNGEPGGLLERVYSLVKAICWKYMLAKPR